MKAWLLKLARLLQSWGRALERRIVPPEQELFVRQDEAESAGFLEKLRKLATFYVDDERFAVNFARDARHFFLRTTGGCGLMGPEHAEGMANLEKALGGEKAGDPFFDGFGVLGCTRMHRISDPSIIVPGITEVLPAIHRKVKRAAILGIVAMTRDLRYGTDDTGILLDVNEENDFYTIVHPDVKSVLMVKPDEEPLPDDVLAMLSKANNNRVKEIAEVCEDKSKALWRAEYRQCLKFAADLMKLDDWRSLLLVYNGGGITEEEILIWAALGKVDPRWQVLLVKGSGRKSDQYANDAAWLAEHPTVHVAENSVKSIRSKLLQLGAIRHPRKKS